MQYEAKTSDEYIAGLPEDRKIAISALRKVINDNLPKGLRKRWATAIWDGSCQKRPIRRATIATRRAFYPHRFPEALP